MDKDIFFALGVAIEAGKYFFKVSGNRPEPMYKTGMLAAFMLVGCIAFCQEAHTSLFKLWSEDDLLQWEDYTITHERRILKTGFLADAVTSYQYRFIPGNWDVYDCINVATLFIKGNSWVTDTLNHAVLAHERIHFDIGELYARKLRRELHILYEERNVNHEIYWKKIDSLWRAAQMYQDVYDQETFYGQIQSTQQLWKDRISLELEQLEDFTFKNMHLRCHEAP